MSIQSSESINMDDEEINEALIHQRKLLRVHQRNLHDREERASQFGINVPQNLVNEINEARTGIALCQAEIVRLETTASIHQKAINNTNFDYLLQLWVSLAEEYGVELPVTLILGGSLVSGYIISYKKYMKELHTMLASKLKIVGVEDPVSWKNSFLTAFDISSYDMQQEDTSQEGEETQKQTETDEYWIIHLRSARIWQPGVRFDMLMEAQPLRFKLRAVDGFMMGTPFTD